MVTRSLTILLCNLALAAVVRGQLQLSPRVVEYELEGVKMSQILFGDGEGHSVTYSPPSGWESSGGPGKFTLRPPGKAQAEGSITTLHLNAPATFDEESMARLTNEMLGSAPAGSTDVALVSQSMNPVVIGQKPTFLVVVSYTFAGQKFERSTLFLNRPTEQVRFRLVSQAQDFDELERAFIGSLFSIDKM